MVPNQLCVALVLTTLALPSALSRAFSRSETVAFQDDLIEAEAGGMQTIRIVYNLPLDDELSIHYGSCEISAAEDCHHTLGRTHVGNHPLAKRYSDHPSQRPQRFVWLPPDDIVPGGCLHAFSGTTLMGRSNAVTVRKRQEKRWVAAADIMDAEGPWFDGVEHLKEKEPDEVFVSKAKSRSIGILGGGMSGLMTAHLLDSVGFHDWTIVEASGRIGGRVHTSYLNATKPDQYQYQEMGPMRFPVEVTYPGNNETLEIKDHRMVFQLAGVLNDQNGHDPGYEVNFIPWIQSASGDPATTPKRRPDGTVPSLADVEAHPKEYSVNPNATYSNATAVALAEEAWTKWTSKVTFKDMANNIFQAHKKAVQDGYFDWSEAGYIYHVLQNSKNITDQVDPFTDYSPSWLYENLYFSATKWRTIDMGLSRLPAAFGPQVLNRTVFQTTVQGMTYDEDSEKVTIQYRSLNLFDVEPETMEFDYAVVAVPFSRVRLWDPMPAYSNLLVRAIENLHYDRT